MTTTWSDDVKRDVAGDLKRIISELDAAIANDKRRGDGERANRWREAQVFIESLEAEIRMWIAIRERNANAAWEQFVTAQDRAARAAGRLDAFEPAQEQVTHLDEVERVAFPQQAFFLSTGFIVDEEDQFCTLCDAVYGTCGHIKGELYEGEMAARETRKIRAVREVSLVNEPSSKRHRIFNVGGIDPLTGEAPGK